MYTWKTIKVFVSSTFKDLELERDDLVKIFQKLQQHFFARKVAIIPYDLRWRQKHEEQDLVKWCIEKTEQCQYFVGILGHRYGWRPDTDEQGQSNTGRFSITEMEIRHSQKVIAKDNRFYFCEDVIKTPEEVNETAEDLASLQKLKGYLKEQGEKTFAYAQSQEILQKVYEELLYMIDRDYPETLELQSASLTSMRQEIIQEKVKGFVGRENYLQQLQNFCGATEFPNYLAVCAVAGTGKSSLVAYFVDRLQKQQQLVAWHYMSMGGNTGEIGKILASIAEQLQAYQLLTIDENKNLREQIVEALEKTDQKIILVLDGLDEMQGKALDLTWLPRNLPANIRIVLTTRPVDPWAKIQQLPNVETLELPPLSDQEIKQILENYQSTYAMKLAEEEKALLLQRAHGSPLFLKVALDEILSSGMAVGQLAESVDRLFDQVLIRLENKHGKSLIEKYLGTIAASRSGLSENEITEILVFNEESQVGDDLVLTLQKSLENFLIQRNHLLNFFHPEFERTIKMRIGKAQIRHYHQLLSEYLQTKGWDYDRAQYELPYQLQWGEKYPELLKLLTNPEFLQKKSTMIADLFEDFERCLTETAVAIPENIVIESTIGAEVNKSILRDLHRILQLRQNFLKKFPQSLFQCVWNLGYWTKESSLLHRFVESWREKYPSQYWLKSLKPLANTLDSPLYKILQGHLSRVTNVRFSPDGERIVSCGGIYDYRVRIWDLYSAESVHIMKGHSGSAESAQYTPDGKHIVSAGHDGKIILWDAQTGESLRIVDAEHQKISHLEISPDGKYVAVAGQDHNIHLWSVDLQQHHKTLSGHQDWVKSIAFCPQNNLLVSGARDKAVKVWDWQSGECLHSFTHDAEVWSVAFHPQGEKVISCSRDQTIRIWNLTTQTCEKILEGHIRGGVNAVAVSHNGKWIASGGEDRTVRIWDEKNGNCIKVFRGHRELLKSVAFSPKDDLVVSCSKDRDVLVWRLDSEESDLQSGEHQDKIFKVAYHQGKIYSTCPGEIKVWNPEGKLLQTMEGPSGQTTVLNVAKNAIVAAGNDKKIWFWRDLQQPPQILSKHKSGVLCVYFDEQQQCFLSASRDKTVCLWEIQEDKIAPVKVYKGHSDWVQKAIFHPSIAQIASCGKDTTVRIWDRETQECLHVLENHKGWVRSIAYSSNGKYIASASADKKLCLWSTETGECLQVFKGHNNEVRGVVFIENDTKLVSISFGHTLVWDITTSTCLQEFTGYTSASSIASGQRYLAFAFQDITSVYDQQTQQYIAWWPSNTDWPFICPENVLVGGAGSGYLSMAELQGIS